MPFAAMVLPGPITSLTGGSIYDRRIVDGLRARGWTIDVSELSASFPDPSFEALVGASKALERLPDGAAVIVDGLAFGAMPAVAEQQAARLRLIALVHLPLAQAVGLEPEVAAKYEAAERRSLAAARMVIATGRPTVETLGGYGVPRDGIVLVEPGTDRVRPAEGAGDERPHLLCVASLTPGKGHDVLLHALARLRDLPWTLTCVGSLTRHPPTVAAAREIISRERMEDRVKLAGELDGPSLSDCYGRADLFALTSARETYGMAVAEAVAHGLPVVAMATGAIPEIVDRDGANEAGLVVDAGDAAAFGSALARVLADAGLRRRLRAGALRARDRLPTWDDAVGRIVTAIESVARR